jgi:hypothetical protein
MYARFAQLTRSFVIAQDDKGRGSPLALPACYVAGGNRPTESSAIFFNISGAAILKLLAFHLPLKKALNDAAAQVKNIPAR